MFEKKNIIITPCHDARHDVMTHLKGGLYPKFGGQ
jgi:hypothetical protein